MRCPYFLRVRVTIIVFLVAALHPIPTTNARQNPFPLVTPATPPIVRAASGQLPADGGALALPVEVRHVTDLGAATVVVGYDPALLTPTACQRSSHFDVGVCNRSLDRNNDGTPDAVRFNVTSLDGVSTGDTPLTLTTITWTPLAPPAAGTDSPLSLDVTTFTDQNGIPMSFQPENGRVLFQPAVALDHIQTLASRLGQPASTNDLYDLVPDDTIDLLDLIALADLWPSTWPSDATTDQHR